MVVSSSNKESIKNTFSKHLSLGYLNRGKKSCSFFLKLIIFFRCKTRSQYIKLFVDEVNFFLNVWKKGSTSIWLHLSRKLSYSTGKANYVNDHSTLLN